MSQSEAALMPEPPSAAASLSSWLGVGWVARLPVPAVGSRRLA